MCRLSSIDTPLGLVAFSRTCPHSPTERYELLQGEPHCSFRNQLHHISLLTTILPSSLLHIVTGHRTTTLQNTGGHNWLDDCSSTLNTPHLGIEQLLSQLRSLQICSLAMLFLRRQPCPRLPHSCKLIVYSELDQACKLPTTSRPSLFLYPLDTNDTFRFSANIVGSLLDCKCIILRISSVSQHCKSRTQILLSPSIRTGLASRSLNRMCAGLQITQHPSSFLTGSAHTQLHVQRLQKL